MANLNRNIDPRRHAWLMTDTRIGAALIPTLCRLPPGAGVVFRHYDLPRGRAASVIRAGAAAGAGAAVADDGRPADAGGGSA
ncbi:MAG: hypothetical protein PGN08_13520 [Sphingomonas taxi]